LRRFFEPSRPLVTPHELVRGFTGKGADELTLPERAIIVFDTQDLRRLLKRVRGVQVQSWASLRPIYRVEGTNTILTRSYFAGPNIAACVEELGAFGVREFIIWGYCGAIEPSLRIGDLLAARAALREDGVSHHYLEHRKAFIATGWFDHWRPLLEKRGVKESTIWSCDAIYRETTEKVTRYVKKGIAAVEMEVASLYAVAEHHGFRALALLIVSDELHGGRWKNGFNSPLLKEGIDRLSDFTVEELIR
jgi:uridine phosphorylase